MFVFISKLFPIFIYPLGLAITLLVAALLLRHFPRWGRIAFTVAAMAWLGAVVLRGVYRYRIWRESAEQHNERRKELELIVESHKRDLRS